MTTSSNLRPGPPEHDRRFSFKIYHVLPPAILRSNDVVGDGGGGLIVKSFKKKITGLSPSNVTFSYSHNDVSYSLVSNMLKRTA